MVQQDLFGNMPSPAPRPKQVHKLGLQPLHTWFFALRPGVEDAARIQAFADELLQARGMSGKRIPAERLHITLELIGHDVDEAVVAAACLAADTVRSPAFEARFERAGSFSAPSGPFVLLGGQGLDEVRSLRTSLGCALADHGFAPPQAYEPHMTLCYDRRQRVAFTPILPLGFPVGEFALIKSHIGLSRHEIMRTWRLAG
jgi:2'-5' RNA ligase